MCKGKDIENVTLSGTVYDNGTKQPVKNAEVKITNTFHTEDDYNQSGLYLIKTDEKGRFEKRMEKSTSVELKVSKEGYLEKVVTQDVGGSEVTLDCYLEKK